MVSALDSRSSCAGMSPGWGDDAVFLSKSVYSVIVNLFDGNLISGSQWG